MEQKVPEPRPIPGAQRPAALYRVPSLVDMCLERVLDVFLDDVALVPLDKLPEDTVAKLLSMTIERQELTFARARCFIDSHHDNVAAVLNQNVNWFAGATGVSGSVSPGCRPCGR